MMLLLLYSTTYLYYKSAKVAYTPVGLSDEHDKVDFILVNWLLQQSDRLTVLVICVLPLSPAT